eukprot:SAG31_NODE_343_length_17426_cov_35.294443_1_plen_75_part_00
MREQLCRGHAIAPENTEVIEMLLAVPGINVNTRARQAMATKHGGSGKLLTALGMAIEKGNRNSAHLIRQAGGRT